MRRLLPLFFLAAPALTQEWGDLTAMHHYRECFGLPEQAPSFRVTPLESNAPGNVFWPGDAPRFGIQIENLTDAPLQAAGRIEIVRYSAGYFPGDDWNPDLRKLADVGSLPLDVDLPPHGWRNLTIEPPTPETKGGYALVVDLGAAGRAYLTSYVRTFAASGEVVQYPKQALEEMPPEILARLGVQAVRYGVSYWASDEPGYAEFMSEIGGELRAMHANRVTCVAEIGAGRHPMPLGRPRPHLTGDGLMEDTKSDYVWPTTSDDDYEAFVYRLASEYGWPKGPITGFMLWNEPWEGLSISGWGADMIRYRELYKRMGEAIFRARREAGVDVLIGGCDSSTNTWDKLFADGTDDWLPYLDFCSIHYQGLQAPVLHRLWNQRRQHHGRVLIWDTESWVANSDDRVAGVVATNRAAGYDRSMGHLSRISIATLSHRRVAYDTIRADAGDLRVPRLIESRPPAASIGAVQHFIGEREFAEILFQTGLPWVYRFEGRRGDPDDGTVVVVGDIDTLFSHAGLFRGVRPTAAQATLSMPADPAYALFDFYGNEVPAAGGRVVIPLDTRGFFLRPSGAAGSMARLIETLREARVEGLEVLDVVARDFTAPVDGDAVLRLTLTSQRNEPMTGRLSLTVGDLAVEPPGELTFAPRETKELRLPVRGAPVASNRYPLALRFDAGAAGTAEHREELHVNLIAHRAIAVDGRLDDWAGALPQTVASDEAAGASFTERMWLPFAELPAGETGGLSVGYVAWNDEGFCFAARIADDSPSAGAIRFANRDEDADFYPEVCYEERDGRRQELRWPAGERRFSYRRWPALPSGYGSVPYDNVLLAFNAIADEDDEWELALPGRMPRFVGYKDTDYEFALNHVAPEFGGGSEVWRLLVPGMPRKHFYPRQPRGPLDGPAPGARMITRYEQGLRITEAVIPWSEIPHVRALREAGRPLKFTFRVNHDTGGPTLELARGRSVSQRNSQTFHPDWAEHWSNEVEFGWERR